jgi:hypothetical protein
VADVVVNTGGDAEPESNSNCKAFDVPPPGAGFCTVVTVLTPILAIAAVVTWAVSWFALTNCVLSVVVPREIVELDTNPEPSTVRAKP